MKKIVQIIIIAIVCYNIQGQTSITVGDPQPSSVGALTVKGLVYIQENDEAISINPDLEDDYLLWVEKGVVSEDFAIVDKENWLSIPDYVFAPDYKLPTLEEINIYVQKHKHLPGIIGEKQLQKDGLYDVNDMLFGQLKNLEELILHTISQEKEIKKQAELLEVQEQKLQQLEQQLDILLQKD